MKLATIALASALIACVGTLADVPIDFVLPPAIVPKLVASAAVPLPCLLFDFSFTSPK